MIKMNTPPSSSSGFLSAANNYLSASGSESDYGAADYTVTTTATTTTTLNNNIPPKTEEDASYVEELLQQADNDDLIIKTEVFHSLSDNDQSPAPPLTPQNYANDPTVFAPPSYHSFNSFPQVRNNSQFTGYVQNHHPMGYLGDMHSQPEVQPPPPENYWYQHPMKPPPTATPAIHHPPPSSPFMFNPPQPSQSGLGRPVPSYYHPNSQQQKQMAEMLHFSNSGREARNRAEKNRRDKLNGSIQELTTMVPHVAESPRRVDKTAVLRYAAHGLRLQYVFKDSLHRKPTKPMFITDILMKMVDSFMIGITCHGQIVLITASVEQHLGHCQTDLYGQNITQITHPDDHNILKKELMPQDLDTLFDIQPDDDSGEPRPRTAEEEEEIDRRLREDRRTFSIRMSRAVPRSEAPCYEIVKIDGCFRRADSAPRGVKTSTFPSGMQLIRRARGRDESFQLHNISGNDIIFVGMARVLQTPKIQTNFTKGNLFEYKTRHLIDGRIVDCDTRISLVAGYMPGEVKDLSPFSFMHEDDVRWVIVALRQMYDNSDNFGESCYRLVGRNGKFVYLKSRGYLEFDEDMKNVRSFICVNTMISEEEGRKALLEMKNRFAIMVNVNGEQAGISSSSEDCLASENPHQLEKAVLCLIKDLPNGNDDKTKNRNGYGDRNSRTPPVAYIPPDSDAVRSSISKSVSVIYEKIGIGKQFRQNSCSPSPSSMKSPSSQSSPPSGDDVFEEQKPQQPPQNRPSVLQTTASTVAVPSRVQIKQEYMSRVPPLPNDKCDCYFNNIENCTKCGQHRQQSQLPTSNLKRPCDYFSDSESGEEVSMKKSRITSSEDSPQSSAYQLSHSDQRIIDIENDRRNFTMPTSKQLQLEEILDQDISDQQNVVVNIKSENESSPSSTSSVRSPMNNMYYHLNNENDLKPR